MNFATSRNDINNSNLRLQKESSERYERKVIGYEIYNPISFPELQGKDSKYSLKSRSADGRAINVGRLSLYDPLVYMPSFKTQSV